MLKNLFIIIAIIIIIYGVGHFASVFNLIPAPIDKSFTFNPNPGSTINVTLRGYLYNATEPKDEFNFYFTSHENSLTHCTIVIDGQHVSRAKVRYNAAYYNSYLNEVIIKINDKFSLGQNYDESSYYSPVGRPHHIKLHCLQGHIDWDTDSLSDDVPSSSL